jgi:serine phosphatase RsbU (regulator of sigma subunit)
MAEIRKLSGRIFTGIFLSAVAIFLTFTLVNYLYTKATLVRLTNNIVERTFRSAYNQLESQILPIFTNAENTFYFLKKSNCDSADIQALLAETNKRFPHLYSARINIENKLSGKIASGCIPDRAFLTVTQKPLIDSAKSKTQLSEGTNYAVSIQSDTITLNSFYSDTICCIALAYDFPVSLFLNTINRETRQLNSRHYLFNNSFESISNTTDTLNFHERKVELIDIQHIQPFIEKGRFGYFPSKDFYKGMALYVSRLRGTNLIVASVMETNEIVKRFRTFYVIIFLIAILTIGIFAYIFQLIVIRLTSPLAELSSIGKKMGKGLMQIDIPEHYKDQESAQLASALRTIQQRTHRYVSSLNMTLKEKRALEHDLSVAEKIQLSMLPPADDAFGTLPELDIYCHVIPAKGVAGDFYDYFLLDDEHLFFVLGDVSGKGIPAALLMAKTITLLQIEARSGKSPGEVFTAVSDQLTFRNEEGMFVTAVCGIINMYTGETELCDAGHHEPLININSDSFYYTKLKKNMPLGILIGGKPYESTHFKLKAGEAIILYSDGLPEAANSAGKMLGSGAIVDELVSCSGKTATVLARRIWNFYGNYTHNARFNDDVSLFILKFLGKNN